MEPGARTIGEVKQSLRVLIEEHAGIPADLILDDSTITGDLAMDSLSFISVQVGVEETFGIMCTPEDLEACGRFDAIAALVLERLSARPTAFGEESPNTPPPPARRNGDRQPTRKGRSRSPRTAAPH